MAQPDEASWILEWAGVAQEAETQAGKGLLLIAEQPAESFLQKARDIAEALTLGMQVICVGEGVREAIAEKGLATCEGCLLSAPFPVPPAQLAEFVQVVQGTGAEIVLFQNTLFARQVAPYLAEKLGVGLAGPAIDFSFDFENRRLIQTVSYYEGRLNADIICQGSPQVIILK